MNSKPNPTLHALLSNPYSPPFIYIHHPHHPSSSPSVLSSFPPNCLVTKVDGVEHHTPRLLYSSILSQLTSHLSKLSQLSSHLPTSSQLFSSSSHLSGPSELSTMESEEGVSTWDGFSRKLKQIHKDIKSLSSDQPAEVDTSSTFDTLHTLGHAGLSNISESIGQGSSRDATTKRQTQASGSKEKKNTQKKQPLKEDEKDDSDEIEEREKTLVVIITKAERLRSSFGHGWSVITRMAELTDLPITVIFCSQLPWDELRPPRGDSLEPVHIYIPPPSRQNLTQSLLPCSSHPLWSRFLDLIISSLSHLPPYPIEEIHYLSLSLWPIYIRPLPPHSEQTLLSLPSPTPDTPPLTITLKLLTDLKLQLSLALQASTETLLPRLIGRSEFLKAFLPISKTTSRPTLPQPPPLELPLCGKYLLIASYCASQNPPKSDVRLFGRGTGPDGKRKKGGGRRTGYGKMRIGKVPQRLLGPKPFGLDRMLAMFSSLFSEHVPRPEDLDSSGSESEEEMDGWLVSVEEQRKRVERKRRREEERDLKWEEEVEHLSMSVRLWTLIPQLENQNLLKRISPMDRLDNMMFRCEVDYDTVKNLARELKFTLDDYLYEGTF
ncbi:hypothetical protein TREMEDRAFT_68006 [Tremella mesenterica DSM 1558]|uniref:uncharacterized protein n=1 Tax=Tremella mesenterica (strain ATCC 24925 / CBS 8224 / DSM 1558 / NBRC 9311 / NRRL Y-6157 / RJB 2259-6 / UBC 559-6) TaxID=578456 RepID=UPI0003F4A5C0|nr:uncharacterized protein TREMEDRAFT_68006 [Tremella mesenterica DSM 1558]EIW70339.1 hypothetical protein TREMEDRAFT_68006 [Tremella mesenterica DSM 1558]